MKKLTLTYAGRTFATGLLVLAAFGRGQAEEPVSVAPVGSVVIPDDTCKSQNVTVTYTAAPIHLKSLNQLQYWQSYSPTVTMVFNQTMLGGMYSTRPVQPFLLEGTPLEKLHKINKSIFGVEEPPVGTRGKSYQASVTFPNGQGCIPHGGKVCMGSSGIFNGSTEQDRLGTPRITFPDEYPCAGYPEGDDYCYFGSPGVLVDLGKVRAGGPATGTATLALTCKGAGAAYSIELLSGGGTISGPAGDFDVSVDGQQLPAGVTGTAGTRSLNVRVDGQTAAGGTGPFSLSSVVVLRAQ
ncbi:hypothetical protein CKOHBEJN_00402 [Aeromonas hydrophila]|uniref:hypothetical protein n=1 Tax=Aeromonas hydrophila TaxID=644 RepID=UPI003670AE29